MAQAPSAEGSISATGTHSVPVARRAVTAFIVLTIAVVLVVVALRGVEAMKAVLPAAPAADGGGQVTAADAVDPYLPDTVAAYIEPPPIEPPPVGEPTEVIVSLTFDDGFNSQMPAARALDQYGFPGTFFINSGSVGKPGYLTLNQLRTLADGGHEIGGHSLSHQELPTLKPAEIRREICLDRAVLTGWGFTVRNFAYPFAATNPAALESAMDCGYNSARSLGDLENRFGCEGCPVTESIPPRLPDQTAALSNVTDEWTLEDFKDGVTAAQAEGGWVQFTFHKLCTTDCDAISVKESVYMEFLDWLDKATKTSNVVVRSVEQVIGGPVRPLVDGPTTAPVAAESPVGMRNRSLELLEPKPRELPENVTVPFGLPECWQASTFGDHRANFTTGNPARSGGNAVTLTVDDYVDGEAKLIQRQDLGTCAPGVVAGEQYVLEAWYQSSAPTQFSISYRLERGVWVYWTSSPVFPTADAYTKANWTTPPIPEGATAISFGLALQQNGKLTADDYSLREAENRARE